MDPCAPRAYCEVGVTVEGGPVFGKKQPWPPGGFFVLKKPPTYKSRRGDPGELAPWVTGLYRPRDTTHVTHESPRRLLRVLTVLIPNLDDDEPRLLLRHQAAW